MSFVVTLQHDGTRDLRGCMIMQSTAWPWRVGASGCSQSNALRRKRIATVWGKFLRLVVLQSQQQHALRSRASPSRAENQNGYVDRAPASSTSISQRTVGGFGPTFGYAQSSCPSLSSSNTTCAFAINEIVSRRSFTEESPEYSSSSSPKQASIFSLDLKQSRYS